MIDILKQYIDFPDKIIDHLIGRDLQNDLGKIYINLLDWKSQFEVDKNGNFIHPEAKFVSKDAIITNSYIGKNVSIFENVNIRESVIYENSVIGHGSEIARSFLLSNISVPRFNYVGSTILGNNVRLGGMTTFASKRIDESEVIVTIKDDKFQTGLIKFGSIVGDNTTVSFASHINPGTVIGRNTIIMPYVDLVGYVDHNVVVSNIIKSVITKKRKLERIGLNSISRKNHG